MQKLFRAHLLVAHLLFAAVVIQQPVSALTKDGPASWGSPDRSWATRRRPTTRDRERIAAFRNAKRRPDFTTAFNDPAELKSDWVLKEDDVTDLQSCRRPENISVKTGVLKLRTELNAAGNKKWSTGTMWSSFKQRFGFIEAAVKITDCTGINNAFWMVTDDGFEIDIAEVHYPGTVRTTLHNHHDYQPVKGAGKTDNDWTDGRKSDSVGFNNRFKDDLGKNYHYYGILWTPEEIIFEVDGEPINVLVTKGAIKEAGDIRFSTAVMTYAGKIPVHPENHDMTVNRLHVYNYKPGD
jgi:beta-glucanase (GH16 family)